jgi:hypothetical protein
MQPHSPPRPPSAPTPCRVRLRRSCFALAVPALVALAQLGAPSTAHADRSFDLMLTPQTTDAYSMVTIERAQTPQQYEFGIQTSFGWSRNPFSLTLPVPPLGLTEQRYNLIGNQFTLDLGFFFGLTKFLSIAAVMPLGANTYDEEALGQSALISAPSMQNPTGFPQTTGLYRGEPRQSTDIARSGLRDPRFAAKVRFYGGKNVEIGTLLDATLPFGDRNSFLGERTATFRPKLLFGIITSRLNIAVNFGALIRGSSVLYDGYSNPPIARFQTVHELLWGVGATVYLHRVISIGLEGLGNVPLGAESQFSTPLATLLGTVYVRAVEKWRLFVAGGGGLVSGSERNADGRLLVGFSYSLAPREGGLR